MTQSDDDAKDDELLLTLCRAFASATLDRLLVVDVMDWPDLLTTQATVLISTLIATGRMPAIAPAAQSSIVPNDPDQVFRLD